MPRWPDANEIEVLCKYAKDCRFLMETGSGRTTSYLKNVAKSTGAKFWSIDISSKWQSEDGVKYFHGWSINDSDIIGIKHPDFIEHPNKKNRKKHPDRKWIVEHGKLSGNRDGIRKICLLEKETPDFFFCDTGEYCGLSEFYVLDKILLSGAYFACHDTKFPKSIKGFKILEKMKASTSWDIVEDLDTRRGLVIGKKR